MKKNSIGMVTTFSFSDGLEPVVFDAGMLNDANRVAMLTHGVEARFGDNAAISRKLKDGTVITVTETVRRDAILEMKAHYEKPDAGWQLRVGAVRSLNPTWAAIAQARNVPYETVAAEYAQQAINDLAAIQAKLAG